ncbi:ATP-binding protein [Undibacterium sp.]|uniref:ATP-binding protein n=1 Tax=Undibacterium sp. TaxID=1914977 RepID=UPI002730B8B5|nr:ATP-binding protein [Undibacterium sp.]MDP1978878.1 ATP-binding protein [Undibacterium sp.]
MHLIESPHWPHTLFGRLCLILLSALLMAYALSFASSQWDKMQVRKNHMVYSVGKDVANAISFLDRLPVSERQAWLGKLARNNYEYTLQAAPADATDSIDLDIANEAIEAIKNNLEHPAKIRISVSTEGDKKILQLHLALSDGAPITIRLTASPYNIQWSMLSLLCVQLAIVMLAAWLAVRTATRPLAMLAEAADAMVKPGARPQFPVRAPREVFRAATAFQNMQERIDTYLAERMQILGSITHDLQTPITRLRLRTELMDDDTHRDKMQADLQAMQKLVEQGLAYAKVQNQLQADQEASSKIKLDALAGSLVQDYCDTGQQVGLRGNSSQIIQTRPLALSRLLGNLIDNALKFGSEVEVILGSDMQCAVITVQDRGPGIPEDQWDAVMQPFVRLESSRNRDTGGAGLGLAIVAQLALQLHAEVGFANREGGGLAVSVRLPLLVGVE